MDVDPRSLSVGITTRDRPESLRRAVRSLHAIADLVAEVLIFDDASRVRAEEALNHAAGLPIRVFRDDAAPGPIVGRNRLVESARRPTVLLLDDDAAILTRDAILMGMQAMRRDARVAAVGFAMAEADGKPWPAPMQPSPAGGPRRVRAYVGFAHLLRRDVFLALGGYRELLEFYGEEKEYCLRLAAAGYSVVYLPDARVAHLPDPRGRDRRRYLRQVARNDCLNALLNDPAWRLAWTLPGRFAKYFSMRRAWGIRDPGGPWWLLRSLARAWPAIVRERRPVSGGALRRWRALGVEGEPYEPPAGERAATV